MKNKAAIPGASSRGMIVAATLFVVAGGVASIVYYDHSVRGERGPLLAVAGAMVPPGSDTTESVILRANDVGQLSATGTVSAGPQHTPPR